MLSRNKYVITHGEEKTCVYADELNILNGGEAVFLQVRSISVVQNTGERIHHKQMAPVYIARPKTYDTIELYVGERRTKDDQGVISPAAIVN